MAYVDPEYVAAELTKHFSALPQVSFRCAEPEDESVDGDVAVLLDGAESDLYVQVGGGYLGLNKFEYRPNGDLYGVRHVGVYGVQPDDMARLKHDLGRQLAIKSMAAEIMEKTQ